MKIEFQYAAGVLSVVIVYTMIEHVLGLNSVNHEIGQYTRLAGILFPLLAIYLGMRARRGEAGEGAPFTFLRAFRSGFLVASFLAVLSSLWFLLYGSVINPEFLDTLLAFERNRMLAAGASVPDVSAAVDRLRTMYSFPVQPVVQTVLGIAYGTFFAALAALLMRRRPSPAELPR